VGHCSLGGPTGAREMMEGFKGWVVSGGKQGLLSRVWKRGVAGW